MIVDWKKLVPTSSQAKPWFELMARLTGKKITMNEFDQECAYGALESISTLVYKPVPAMPSDLQRLIKQRRESKNQKEREKLTDKINGYSKFFEDESFIKAHNLSNRIWLKRYLSWIPEEDRVNRVKIAEVIRTHDPYFQLRDKKVDRAGTARSVSPVSQPDKGLSSQDTEHKDKQKTVS